MQQLSRFLLAYWRTRHDHGELSLPGNGVRQGELKWKITFQQTRRTQAKQYTTNALSLSRNWLRVPIEIMVSYITHNERCAEWSDKEHAMR